MDRSDSPCSWNLLVPRRYTFVCHLAPQIQIQRPDGWYERQLQRSRVCTEVLRNVLMMCVYYEVIPLNVSSMWLRRFPHSRCPASAPGAKMSVSPKSLSHMLCVYLHNWPRSERARWVAAFKPESHLGLRSRLDWHPETTWKSTKSPPRDSAWSFCDLSRRL